MYCGMQGLSQGSCDWQEITPDTNITIGFDNAILSLKSSTPLGSDDAKKADEADDTIF